MYTKSITPACEKVLKSCTICSSTERPKHQNNISLTHINEKFNQEVQADFTIAYIGTEELVKLKVIDLGTNYEGRTIAVSRDANTMMQPFENLWLYHHGATVRFSADPGFTKDFFKKFLTGDNI